MSHKTNELIDKLHLEQRHGASNKIDELQQRIKNLETIVEFGFKNLESILKANASVNIDAKMLADLLSQKNVELSDNIGKSRRMEFDDTEFIPTPSIQGMESRIKTASSIVEDVMPVMLCSYGCGQEAVVQFKNGNWCCSKNTNACPAVIAKKVGNVQ